jgi:hypothetical protein
MIVDFSRNKKWEGSELLVDGESVEKIAYQNRYVGRLDGGRVVKCDPDQASTWNSESTRTQCARQITQWESLPEDLRQYVPKLLEHGLDVGGRAWVIEEYVEFENPTKEEMEDEKFKTPVNAVKNALGLWDVDWNSSHNWGIVGDRPVVYDYAL